jgi:ribonucleotide monophosphatase NagD (HAD superfamily)
LNSVFEKNYPDLGPCEIIKYGKPMKPTYDFAKKRLYEKADKMGVDISNFYMIGDNPHADIKGGNDNDCVSILVKTGVFQGLKVIRSN